MLKYKLNYIYDKQNTPRYECTSSSNTSILLNGLMFKQKAILLFTDIFVAISMALIQCLYAATEHKCAHWFVRR